MGFTKDIGSGLRVGDFVRVRARGKWLNETGVVTRVYHPRAVVARDYRAYGRAMAKVLFSNEDESSFLVDEIEFVEREVVDRPRRKRGRVAGRTYVYACENCPRRVLTREEALAHNRETTHALRGRGERIG